jgi:hypothetical protein
VAKSKIDPTTVGPAGSKKMVEGGSPMGNLTNRTSKSNQSSVEGGIFSSGAPTPAKTKGCVDRNYSSVEGGIFG